MADKLTSIKIKQKNGSYTTQIPVSVSAQNVQWDGSHSLLDILGSVDINVGGKGNVQHQFDDLYQNIDAFTDDINSEMTDFTNSTNQNITNFTNSTNQSIADFTNTANQNFTDFTNATNQHLSDVLGNISTETKGTVQAQMDKLQNDMNTFHTQMAAEIGTDVSDWLQQNVTPAGSMTMVDNSLTISDAAADAKAVGDALTSLNGSLILQSNKYNDAIFEQGGITSSTGEDVTSTYQIRTNKLLVDSIDSVKTIGNYRFRIYCYSGDAGNTYAGYYYNGVFYKTANSERLMQNMGNVYKTLSAWGITYVRIVCIKLSDTTWVDLIPQESENCAIICNYKERIKELQKETSIAFENGTLSFSKGGLVSSTGEETDSSSNIQIRTDKMPIENIEKIETDENYYFKIFCYSGEIGDTYLGYYYNGALYNTESNTNLEKNMTGVSELLKAFNVTYIRIVGIKVSSGNWINIVPSESGHFSICRFALARKADVEKKTNAENLDNIEYHYNGVDIDANKVWLYQYPSNSGKWIVIKNTTENSVFATRNLLDHKTTVPMVISYSNENGNVTRRVFAKIDGNDYWTDYGMSGYVAEYFSTIIPASAVDIRIYPNEDDDTQITDTIKIDIIPIDKAFNEKRFDKRVFMDSLYTFSSTNLPSSNGYATTGKLAEVYAEFDDLAETYPDYVTKTLLGKDQTNTYDIYEYRFRPETVGYNNEQSGLVETKNEVKLPLFLLDGCIHGNEQLATIAILTFAKNLCANWQNNKNYEFFRWNVEFRVIPIVNPWGFQNNSRYNSNNIDINREFMKSDATLESECVEALILRNWLRTYKDEAFNYVDLHTIPWASNSRDIVWLISPNNQIDDMSNSIVTRLTRLWKSKYSFLTYDGLMGYVGKALYIDDSIYNSQGREYAYYYLGYKNAITLEIADTVTHEGESKFGELTTNMYYDIFQNTLVAFAIDAGASYSSQLI